MPESKPRPCWGRLAWLDISFWRRDSTPLYAEPSPDKLLTATAVLYAVSTYYDDTPETQNRYTRYQDQAEGHRLRFGTILSYPLYTLNSLKYVCFIIINEVASWCILEILHSVASIDARAVCVTLLLYTTFNTINFFFVFRLKNFVFVCLFKAEGLGTWLFLFFFSLLFVFFSFILWGSSYIYIYSTLGRGIATYAGLYL